MKKIIVAIMFLLFSAQVKANEVPLSIIPIWVKSAESLQPTSKWTSFNQQRFLEERDSEKRSSLFKIPQKKGRLDLSYFKATDPGLFESPLTKDRDKEFNVALPNDFNNLERSKILVRPSWVIYDNTKLTLKKVRVKDDKLEFNLIVTTSFR
jgi:hypothetical protein